MEVTAVHVKAAKTALDSRQTTTTAIAARIRPVVPFSENLRIDYYFTRVFTRAFTPAKFVPAKAS